MAPLAVRVPVDPLQIVEEVDATLGKLFTVMLPVAVFVQPFPSVPVTVYVVLPPGLAVMLVVVAPVLQA